MTISLAFGSGVSANSGTVVAAGQVGTSNCSVYVEDNSSLGSSFIDNCSGSAIGTGFPTGVTLVIPADQASFGDVLDVFAQVEAKVQSGGTGAAGASGTLSVQVAGSGADVIAYQFQNANSFTVPEPGAGGAALAVVGALAALGRVRRDRARSSKDRS